MLTLGNAVQVAFRLRMADEIDLGHGHSSVPAPMGRLFFITIIKLSEVFGKPKSTWVFSHPSVNTTHMPKKE